MLGVGVGVIEGGGWITGEGFWGCRGQDFWAAALGEVGGGVGQLGAVVAPACGTLHDVVDLLLWGRRALGQLGSGVAERAFKGLYCADTVSHALVFFSKVFIQEIDPSIE